MLFRSGRRSAAGEAAPDLEDPRPEVLRRQPRIEERADHRLAQEPQASNSTCRVERNLLILEVRSKRFEIVRGDTDTLLATEFRLTHDAANERGKAPPPFDRRFPRRVVRDIGDHIGVALVGELVEQIPASPERTSTEHSDDDAAEEQRQRERRTNLRSCQADTDCNRREGKARALLVTKLTKMCRSVVHGSRIHRARTVCAPAVHGIGAWTYLLAAFPQSSRG
jgi:hypothetical protein